MPGCPANWAATWNGLKPMVLPSGRALLAMKFIAFMVAAPGMFWTITLGLPGICFSRCCDRNRAMVSVPPGPNPTISLTVSPLKYWAFAGAATNAAAAKPMAVIENNLVFIVNLPGLNSVDAG